MPADPSDRPTFDPDAVAGKSFTQSRRGYEPDEVRAFLLSVASQIRDYKLRYEDLERRLAEVERRAADPRDLDETAVTQLLGEETARVLETARNAAADIRNRAEAEAAAREAEIAERDRITRESADQYSEQVRTAADEADRRVRADADRYSEQVRAAADAETTAQRAAADEYDQRVRVAADAEVAEFRATATAEIDRLRAEAASVLTERTAEAETAASAILGEADGYNTRVRADADRYSEATRAAADSYRSDTQAAADAIKAEAVAESERVRSEAIDDARRLQEEAEAAAAARAEAAEMEAANVVEAAKAQGRTMVEEARAYRERVIADLADRRRAARTQLEELAAIRDALAVTLSDVDTKLAASRRLVGDTSIDLTLLGDVAGDRALLSASDPVTEDPVTEDPVTEDPVAEDPVAEDPTLMSEVATPAGEGIADDSSGEDADVPEAGSVDVATPSADGEASADSRPVDSAADGDDGDGDVDAVDAADAADETPEMTQGGAVGDSTSLSGEIPEVLPEPLPEPLVEELPAAPVEDLPEAQPEDLPEALPEALPPAQPESLDAEAGPDGDSESHGAEAGAADEAGPVDREGRIDAIFARIRADRLEEDQAADAEAEGPASDGDDAEETTDTPATAVSDNGGAFEDDSRTGGGAGTSSQAGADADLLDRRDAALAEIERQLARRLKRVLADEQNETLDLLRRTKGTPTADQVLPADVDHHERYRGAALEDLANAERVGAGFYGEAPNRRADVFDLAGDFAAEILRQIRGQLERAFADGGDEYEMGDRIRACYREWKTQRIADTSRHFVMVAFCRGVAEAADDGASFRWLLDDGDQPCPDCDDNQLGGAVTKGSPFPTGDLCPPAHPGCRCLAVPV